MNPQHGGTSPLVSRLRSSGLFEEQIKVGFRCLAEVQKEHRRRQLGFGAIIFPEGLYRRKL